MADAGDVLRGYALAVLRDLAGGDWRECVRVTEEFGRLRVTLAVEPVPDEPTGRPIPAPTPSHRHVLAALTAEPQPRKAVMAAVRRGGHPYSDSTIKAALTRLVRDGLARRSAAGYAVTPVA